VADLNASVIGLLLDI